MTTTVMVVDDHPVVRAGLVGLINSDPDLEVCAQAATGEEAVTTWQRHRSDVVLMDLRLGPGMDGARATALLRGEPQPPAVLVLTTYDTDADILRAVEAGASGYLLKDAPASLILDAVHRTAAGDTVLAPVVAQRLQRRREGDNELSSREVEVLQRVSCGESNRTIAGALYLSEATVKTHLSHIYTKLGVDSRTAAVARAREQGLIS